MTPEDQNAVDIQQKTENYLQRKLWAYKQWKKNVDTQYANQQEVNMEQDTMNLYQNSLQATDKDVKAQYNVASRWNLLAEMISNVGREKGYDITGNASDIIWTYLQWFPNDSQAFYEFTHWDQDPEDFAVQMGWMEKPENDAGFFTNVVWWVLDSVTWLPKLAAKWAADIIWWTAKQLWADEDKVNYLVNDFKNYMTNEASDIGQDKDSWTYKGTKLWADLIQTATWWWLAKAWIKWALKNAPIVAENVPLWTKAAVWAVEWAWDMALYDMVSESELPSAWDVALWATLWAVTPMLWAWYKAAKAATKKRAISFAEDLLQNTNRMTKWEQSKFYQRFNQSVGKWLNDRWLKSWEDIVNYFTSSKNKVDEALASIKWEFTSKELTDVLDDVVDFATSTNSPQANRMIALAEKNAKWGLTMSEINEVKRFFEAHNKFNYLSKWTAKQAEKATNMDTALRERQFKIAEENWFSNLAELNKETAAAKEILNGVKKWEAWVAWNNPISLTDVIVAFWWGGLSPESMAMYLLKKEWETPAVRSKIVDMLNWIWGHETMTEKVADLEKIMEINKIKDQKALEKYVDDLYKEWWVWDTTPRLTEWIATDAKSGNWWWIEAWEKWFVTTNPTAPNYEELWIAEWDSAKLADAANKSWEKTPKPPKTEPKSPKTTVVNKEDYAEIKKYKWNLRKLYDEAWPDDYVYFSHNTPDENVDAIMSEWIRSYSSRWLDMHWEDAPNLNWWTLEETQWYWWNQIYFRIKKSDVDNLRANRSAWIVMIPKDIPPEDIVAVSRRTTNDTISKWLWLSNKWDLFKRWEGRVDEFGYDEVKNKMYGEYWLKDERAEFENYMNNRK